MAFTLDPTTPADSDSPRQGASKIRALTLQLLQLLTQGGGSAVTFAAAPLSVDTAGNVTIPTTLTVPTPTAIGHAVNKTYADQQGPWTGISTDGPNTYTVSLADTNAVAPLSLATITGIPISVKFTNANTGASTLNANGFGAKPIQLNGAALNSGALSANQYVLLVYDGANFQISGGAGGGTIATKGSYTLPGGLIVKWNAVAYSGASQAETFTAAFPNSAFVAVATSSKVSIVVNITALSTTGLTLQATDPGTQTVYYIALGN